MADRTLLFEIGCEEVPAKMLARALAELPAQATALFAKASLPHGDVNAIGTPRRAGAKVGGTGVVMQASLADASAPLHVRGRRAGRR